MAVVPHEQAETVLNKLIEAGYTAHYADLGEAVRRLGLTGEIAELGDGEVMIG